MIKRERLELVMTSRKEYQIDNKKMFQNSAAVS